VKRRKRHEVYDSIVERLADYGWHDVVELEELTHYPEQWLDSLRRDPAFVVDSADGRLRLVQDSAS
jgi:hypothetical protein